MMWMAGGDSVVEQQQETLSFNTYQLVNTTESVLDKAVMLAVSTRVRTVLLEGRQQQGSNEGELVEG